MKYSDKTKNNIWIYIVVAVILGLVVLSGVFILPRLLKDKTEDSISDTLESQSIEYMELSLSHIENKLIRNSNKFKLMEEIRLDNGLDRLIVQADDEDDRIVLEIIGNKVLDKVSSIYLITWNSEKIHEDGRNIDRKYMVELLDIIFPEFENSVEWIDNSLEELGSTQIVKVINKSQIGLMSMDGFETVGLSILPSRN